MATPTKPPPTPALKRRESGDYDDKWDEDVMDHHGPERYLAYFARISRLFAKVSRFSAYASDVGEAFRPVVPVRVVNATYAISFGYVGCDIAYRGYQAHKEDRSVSHAVAHATVFQGLASLAAPFAIIHTQVALATKVCKKINRFQRWGPTMAGLALIPLLPTMVDEPIEEAVHWAFEKYWPHHHHPHTHHHDKAKEE